MVDWQMRMLHIPRTKDEQPLHVRLNDAALAALKVARAPGGGRGRIFRSERTGEPLEHPRRSCEPALREAAIEGFHQHDLWHTFAARLRIRGTPLEDIAGLLGLTSLAMTKRYAHLGPSGLYEVVARLMAKLTKSGAESGTDASERANHFAIRYVN